MTPIIKCVDKETIFLQIKRGHTLFSQTEIIINENGEAYPLRFALQEQQQTQRDNRHTDYDADDSDFAFFVFPCHREQLFERYKHHNSRNRTKQHAENCVVKERAQQQMTDVYDTVTNDFPALKSSISELLS